MAQHLWEPVGAARCCEVCLFVQTKHGDTWLPPISPICAGDDDNRPPHRGRGPKPLPPSAPEPRAQEGGFVAALEALLEQWAPGK